MPPRKDKDDDSSEEESEEEVSSDEEDEDGSSEEGSEEESEEEEHHVKKPMVTSAPTQVAGKAPPAQAPTPAQTSGGATVIANKPHDEEFLVDEAARKTPPEAKQRAAAPVASGADKQQPLVKSSSGTQQPAPSGGTRGGQKLENNPNDESFAVEDAGRRTPPQAKTASTPTTGAPAATGSAPAPAAAKAAPAPARATKPVGKLQNDPNDEFEDVEDDVSSEDEKEVATPPKKAAGPTGSQLLKNAQHDEAFDVGSASPSSNASSPGKDLNSPTGAPAKMAHGKAIPALAPAASTSAAATGPKPIAKHAPKTAAHAEDDEETGSDEDESSDDDNAPKMKGNVELPAAGAAQTQGLYNPQDYAFLNAKVSREVRDLFAHITSYQPTTVDCPTKLLPFIPSYIPCVGDIDAFCKVPRPDGVPDSLGLVVVDEPSCNQTNTAVEKMRWEYLTVGKVDRDSNVESVENAQNRPQIIDKWISDVKKLPKQLPTVTYSKPMPSIEQLMQIWPPEFEAVLNSDVQLPPPGIDLDIFQYVRVLCAILDIPTYSNLVESLHVMFTLYLEFRANQHFQHS